MAIDRFSAVERAISHASGNYTLDVVGPIADGHEEDGVKYVSYLKAVLLEVPAAPVTMQVWTPGTAPGRSVTLEWGALWSEKVNGWAPRASFVVPEGADICVWNEVRTVKA